MTESRSVFQAHCAAVSSKAEVEAVLAALLQDRRIAGATHNMYAYRLRSPAGHVDRDHDDDGEDAAGGRLAHLLELMQVTNAVVVVSRWYGGVQLGPSRFRYICNVAREVLDLAGLDRRKKLPRS